MFSIPLDARPGLALSDLLHAEEPKLIEEMSQLAEEPLLPIEKKLIGWSLALGVFLLGLLLWLSNTFFLAQP